MTRRTSARVAGITFLLYIAVGVTSLFVGRGSTAGDDTAARIASIAAHASAVRVDLGLGLVVIFIAMILAVALYGITRDVDHELSVLALCCRVAEGVLGALSIVATVALLSIAGDRARGGDVTALHGAVDVLLRVRATNPLISAMFFAVGSTIFSYLLLRGRLVPVSLARLGVVASLLLVVVLPAQLAGFLRSPTVQAVWLPMLVFELTLAGWLLVKPLPSAAPEPR